MATEIKKDPAIFEIIERYDEKQIVDTKDFRDNKALVYKVKGQNELSYLGIKHLSFVMAQNGQPLEPVKSDVDLLGNDREKTWYATVQIRNKTTGQVTEGVSECPFYDEDGKQDMFARTKAHSKAERNAIRKQIPEGLITKMINDAQGNPQSKPTAPPKQESKTVANCTCEKPWPHPEDPGRCVSCKGRIARR